MSKQSEFRKAFPDVHAEVCKFFPDFDYRNPVPGAVTVMGPSNNCVGHQQRAFQTWWSIQQCGPLDLGLDIGAHRGLSPFCIHVDKYYDNQNAHPYYGGVIGCDVVADATSVAMFPKGVFPLIGSNHSLEHMPVDGDGGTVELLKTWVGLLRQGGVIALIVPDNWYWDVKASDADHKHAWSHIDFRGRVLDRAVAEANCELVEYDTLKNNFAFNAVIRKR